MIKRLQDGSYEYTVVKRQNLSSDMVDSRIALLTRQLSRIQAELNKWQDIKGEIANARQQAK